ncbi:unnamed protein product [Caenorhabditis angaria]|uniref:MOSC domain-containing protein n=1 Tax=Caenorhabditis angaria TaxID=860376 RepID=A0A9P1N5H1_9PELO|nr:unnamed protein product [Caenorhabditis angaria]
MSEDRRVLIACLAGSFFVYHTAKKNHISAISNGRKMDSYRNCQIFKCTSHGAVFQGYEDRSFLLVNGKTGKFLTARQHPKLVKVQCEIRDDIVKIKFPNSEEISFNLNGTGKIIRATLFDDLKQDGYDCGDLIANAFSEYLGESDIRLIYHKPGMYTERTTVPESNWWNNPVPKRKDDARFNDLAPFMITTQSSLDALNEKLESKVTTRRFRPSILIDGPVEWDEDKWAEIKIGDVRLECFAPCTRCVLTTVDPELGVMNRDVQPLKTLREFRLAPEGKMREAHKESPVFGVYAGLKDSSKENYIHVGQTVYARYKPSAF